MHPSIMKDLPSGMTIDKIKAAVFHKKLALNRKVKKENHPDPMQGSP
jgi:hypothetical protein